MTTPTTDEDFTELYDYQGGRIDLVGKGANGIAKFLVTKAADGEPGGLLNDDDVRALIAKSKPAPGSQEDVVTVTGSPAAVTKLIAEAAARRAADLEAVAKAMEAYPGDPVEVAKAKADYDLVLKAKYSAEDRRKMAGSGAAMKDGSYPIGDEEDLDKAIHAVGRGGASHDAIRKHIISRAKSLGKSSKIPDSWNSDGSIKESVSKEEAVAADDVAEVVAKDALELLDPEGEGLVDDSADGMDPTVPFAEPDTDEAPGDPTEPGSPAWEAVDAATAEKWLSITARLKNALCMLADRELLEVSMGGDEDDCENAWDLQDAMCAVDFVMDTLACFAAGESAAAEVGAEMEAISKALAEFDTAPIAVVEGMAAVRKAGRVLSAANEQRIKDAAASLQQVLATLPAPVPVEKEDGQSAADKKEGAMPQPETSADQAAASGQEPEMGIAKAGSDEKTTMQAVFDQNGDLIGIVDPAQITPVAGASKPSDGDGDGDGEAGSDGAALGATDADGSGSTPEPTDAPAGDDEPAPPAEAGTPAEGVAKAEADDDELTITRTVLKSIVADAVTEALAAQGAGHAEVVAKMAGDNAGLAEELAVLKGRVETVEQHPAAPKVFANGAVPPPHQMRGQDNNGRPAQIDVAKGLARKHEMYNAPATEQARIANEMQQDAVTALAAMHAAGPAR